MKTIIKFLLIMTPGLGFWGCSEEEDVVNEPMPTTPATTVNFALENQTLSEAGEPLKINLAFDRAATANGAVSIRLSGDADYGENYATAPAASEGIITLNIEKGQAAANFTVTPVNDEDSLGNKTIIFTLENPSAGFKLGNKTASSVELVEDDTVTEPGNGGEEATIEFGENFVHIAESDIEGFDISMLLQGNVKYTQLVFIEVLPTDGFEYGVDYITDPYTMQNNMKLEVYPGLKDLKFRVIPVNDQELSGSFEIKFTISTISEGIKTGAQTSMTVKVEEDDIIDPATLHSIADLRSKFETHTGDWYLPQDYYIEGIITSEDNVIDDKTVFIQDETGGIMLVFYTTKMMNKGDKVQVNLRSAEGKYVNGQKTVMGVIDRVGITLERNVEVAPEVITLEQLSSGNYQGKRVRIQDVTFSEANGAKTWLGSQKISDGERIGYVTTYATAGFSDQLLPAGKVNVTGIVGEWNRLQPQHYYQDVILVR